ncbi:YitT family protein [Oscillospiraceae bacterium HV4-5-C5C]|nr:YitT family protein [Oscillospiraceae bacterium HV4-5-C5C]
MKPDVSISEKRLDFILHPKQGLSDLRATLRRLFTLRRVLLIWLGSAILSFGLYNVHQQTGITEGGVLGLLLLLEHWLGLSPALLSPILDGLCYALALRYLGKEFLLVSAFSTLSFAGFFKLWESFPPLLPDLSAYPLLAALLGALFVGTGVGLVVRQGGSSGGDDALALVISKVTRWRLTWSYSFTDVVVLLLSLTYIPVRRIAYSLVTVLLSSYLIDRIQGLPARTGKAGEKTQSKSSGPSAGPARKPD